MEHSHALDQPEILSRLFFPRREPKSPLPDSAVDIDFAMKPDISIGCRFYLRDPAAPSILYFHGNGETVCDHDDIGPEYVHAGCNLLLMTYRGYGWSSGSPSVSSLLEDGRRLHQSAVSWLEDKGYTGPLFLMGRSLGSACAIDLALLFGDSVKGLIIESGFANTLPLLETLGISAPRITEEECFGNTGKIEKIKMPTLILHGARDQLIPSSEAEKLQAASGARNKQFILIPGAGHNTMISTAGKLYFTEIKRFIDSVTGASSWRNVRKGRH